ncbi:SET domain-containing protein [Acanthopleuribacter pedis]|uniref:SET domain-containing protein n=1 Tax=Acanthopleuribacter pedis TaxID=442870 RepID=A0A8J7Q3B3_9BACT|nr:SET domain-containing protein [Acanthopleuribacter pedis]MBO1318480.1 SET domain-containing protein [Acanthopleuribacter pedis]
MTETSRLDLLNDLLVWCREHGAEMPDQRFEVDAHGQCLVRNNRDFAAGDRALKLPRTCMFMQKHAAETPLVQAFHDAGGAFQTMHGMLAVGVLQEFPNPDSFWAPYWAVLPRSFDSVPLFLADDLFPFLTGTMTQAMAVARFKELTAELSLLQEKLDSGWTFSQADFFWAYTLCSSRAFAVPDGEGGTVPALVPLLDLYNHLPECNLSSFRPDPDGIVLETPEGLPADTELLVSYGAASDVHYFVNYGFVDHAMRAGQSRLVLQLNAEDPQAPVKRQLMNGTMVWEMMVTAADFDAINACLTIARWVTAVELRPQIESLTAQEEIAALRLLFAELGRSVAGFYQTFEQDVADLARPDGTWTFAEQMVRRATLSEKRVLLQARVFCARALEALDAPALDWQAPEPRWIDDGVVAAWVTTWRASLPFLKA